MCRNALLMMLVLLCTGYVMAEEKTGDEKQPIEAKEETEQAAEEAEGPEPEPEPEQEEEEEEVAGEPDEAVVEVPRAAICLQVINREPEGTAEEFPNDVSKLYCFSHVRGTEGVGKIHHKWYYEGDLLGTVTLPVRARNWRTYSYHTITPTMTGDWRVEIVNAMTDELLKVLRFSVK